MMTYVFVTYFCQQGWRFPAKKHFQQMLGKFSNHHCYYPIPDLSLVQSMFNPYFIPDETDSRKLIMEKTIWSFFANSGLKIAPKCRPVSGTCLKATCFKGLLRRPLHQFKAKACGMISGWLKIACCPFLFWLSPVYCQLYAAWLGRGTMGNIHPCQI